MKSAEHIQWDAALAAGRARVDRVEMYAALAAASQSVAEAMRRISLSAEDAARTIGRIAEVLR